MLRNSKHTKETIEKMRKRQHTPETKKKISDSMLKINKQPIEILSPSKVDKSPTQKEYNPFLV